MGNTRKTLAVTAVVADLLAVSTIGLAVANVFRKIKQEKMLDNAVYKAITWEHNLLIPASFLIFTGTFITIYLVLTEPEPTETLNPL